mmetsp:Transcript_48154/g.89792  ORF Transcript_48154/g.89792 Transcript_48154/m.89792 type:complete len:231 (-) Transcript_48154:164-856(-)
MTEVVEPESLVAHGPRHEPRVLLFQGWVGLQRHRHRGAIHLHLHAQRKVPRRDGGGSVRPQKHVRVLGGGQGEDSRERVGVKPEDVTFGDVEVGVLDVARSKAPQFLSKHLKLFRHGPPRHESFLLRALELTAEFGHLKLRVFELLLGHHQHLRESRRRRRLPAAAATPRPVAGRLQRGEAFDFNLLPLDLLPQSGMHHTHVPHRRRRHLLHQLHDPSRVGGALVFELLL